MHRCGRTVGLSVSLIVKFFAARIAVHFIALYLPTDEREREKERTRKIRERSTPRNIEGGERRKGLVSTSIAAARFKVAAGGDAEEGLPRRISTET